MLLDILITLFLTVGLALAFRRDGALIENRPYNNRYNDASGAREDHLG